MTKTNNIKTWDKIGLYITSLWLLFFLIFVLKVDIFIFCDTTHKFIGFKELLKRNIVPISSLIFLVIGLGYYKSFNYRISGTCYIQTKIKRLRNKNYEHITFLTTYIIPLIAFNLNETRYLITLIILLFIIGVIYVKTDLFFANPSLALLGYHIYEIDTEYKIDKKAVQHNSITVITKELFAIENEINLMILDDNIFYGKNSKCPLPD